MSISGTGESPNSQTLVLITTLRTQSFNQYNVLLTCCSLQVTAHFMVAGEVLTHAINERKIFQKPHHDLESFLRVLGYAVVRHTYGLIMVDPDLKGHC